MPGSRVREVRTLDALLDLIGYLVRPDYRISVLIGLDIERFKQSLAIAFKLNVNPAHAQVAQLGQLRDHLVDRHVVPFLKTVCVSAA